MRDTTENTSKIIPRWEWRTFNADDELLKSKLSNYQPLLDAESIETYLLVPDEELNLKIRHHILDVKHRLKLDSTGQEQWLPIINIKFPLDVAALNKIEELLDMSFSSATNERSLSEANFIELLAQEPHIAAVSVAKFRQKYEIEGIQGEFTKLQIDNHYLFTLALEHEDPGRILNIRKSLGLEKCISENYPEALKHAIATGKGD
ncbi:MAG: hypothetical protein ISR87_13590 [Candidatus Marinimicrobia bacterium]|nr:hypothetical protein [FCB group bacterium]MBL7026474.1 hypothetical protein [Candidatus Neomarinimicrobiota bacterium]